MVCPRSASLEFGVDAAGLTLRVGARLNLVQKFHVGNVVDVNALLEDDHQPSAVELDGENGRRERKLADGGLPLWWIVVVNSNA